MNYVKPSKVNDNKERRLGDFQKTVILNLWSFLHLMENDNEIYVTRGFIDVCSRQEKLLEPNFFIRKTFKPGRKNHPHNRLIFRCP